jgi:hypothetical protein
MFPKPKPKPCVFAPRFTLIHSAFSINALCLLQIILTMKMMHFIFNQEYSKVCPSQNLTTKYLQQDEYNDCNKAVDEDDNVIPNLHKLYLRLLIYCFEQLIRDVPLNYKHKKGTFNSYTKNSQFLVIECIYTLSMISLRHIPALKNRRLADQCLMCKLIIGKACKRRGRNHRSQARFHWRKMSRQRWSTQP